MDRRSFIRSMFIAGAAAVTGAALLPHEVRAASLVDILKGLEGASATADAELSAPDLSAPDLPAPGAREVQFRRRRSRRVCVTRVGPRGRVFRICRWG